MSNHLSRDLLVRLGPQAKTDDIDQFLAGAEHLRRAGIVEPIVLAHFLAQIAHESGGFKHRIEIWGPTPAQVRYDTRTDLGNTPEKDGDGYKYRGRGLIQLTGKANYIAFTRWAKATFGADAPDFVKTPDLVASYPWALLTAVWYWDVNKLSPLARRNDIVAITKKINGGDNGFDDRLFRFDLAAMTLLGYAGVSKTSVRAFQQKQKLKVDGVIGNETRKAFGRALIALESDDDVLQSISSDFGKDITRDTWTPKSTDMITNLISWAMWAFGRLIRFKTLGR